MSNNTYLYQKYVENLTQINFRKYIRYMNNNAMLVYGGRVVKNCQLNFLQKAGHFR